jgi:hypothetical protein
VSRRWEIIIGAAVFVFLLWEGGYPGWAALIALGGVATWWVDASLFHVDDCWCDRGWVVSRLSGKRRPHKACGNTGRRPRLAHRLWKRADK